MKTNSLFENGKRKVFKILEHIFLLFLTDNDIGDAQDTLLHSFRSSTSACLVCIETIKKNDPVSTSACLVCIETIKKNDPVSTSACLVCIETIRKMTL